MTMSTNGDGKMSFSQKCVILSMPRIKHV